MGEVVDCPAFVYGRRRWDFKPGSINSGVQQMRDPERLYFGIWTEEPNVASESHSYQYFPAGCNEPHMDCTAAEADL